MAFDDDYRAVRDFIAALDAQAAGHAKSATEGALESLRSLRRRHKVLAKEERLSRDDAKRARAKYEAERSEAAKLAETVRVLRADLMEQENRVKTERLNARAARRCLEKARADGYEEGLAEGLKLGRRGDG